MARQHGVTMHAVADGGVDIPGLKEMPNVMRAGGYRKNIFAQLDTVKGCYFCERHNSEKTH